MEITCDTQAQLNPDDLRSKSKKIKMTARLRNRRNFTWDEEKEERLFDLWESHDFLYNLERKDYTNTFKKKQTRFMFARELDVPVDEVDRRLRSLRTQFCRDRKKLKMTKPGETPEPMSPRGQYLQHRLAFLVSHLRKKRKASSLAQGADGMMDGIKYNQSDGSDDWDLDTEGMDSGSDNEVPSLPLSSEHHSEGHPEDEFNDDKMKEYIKIWRVDSPQKQTLVATVNESSPNPMAFIDNQEIKVEPRSPSPPPKPMFEEPNDDAVGLHLLSPKKGVAVKNKKKAPKAAEKEGEDDTLKERMSLLTSISSAMRETLASEADEEGIWSKLVAKKMRRIANQETKDDLMNYVDKIINQAIHGKWALPQEGGFSGLCKCVSHPCSQHAHTSIGSCSGHQNGGQDL